MSGPSYRFRFSIIDETSGDVIGEDWCSFDAASVHQDGGCETVDHSVARTLGWFNRTGRAEHEAANYAPAEEEQRQQIGRDKARLTLAELSKSELLR